MMDLQVTASTDLFDLSIEVMDLNYGLSIQPSGSPVDLIVMANDMSCDIEIASVHQSIDLSPQVTVIERDLEVMLSVTRVDLELSQVNYATTDPMIITRIEALEQTSIVPIEDLNQLP